MNTTDNKQEPAENITESTEIQNEIKTESTETNESTEPTESTVCIEKEKRISALSKRKVGLERNASLCAVVLALLCYNTWSAFSQDEPPVWFLPIMGALVAGCLAIILYDLINGHKIKKELASLRSELESELNTNQNSNSQ